MINRDEWMAALAEAGAAPAADEPDALTVREFAELIGCGITAARGRIAALLEAGKARRVVKRIRDIEGRRQTVTAYRLEGK